MSKKKNWKFKDIPSQTGKVAIVTGANRGIGFEVVKTLARKGAQVIMACRNLDNSEKAKEKILSEYPNVKIDIIHLDLANLSSIREFVTKFQEKYSRLDILCNNAGIFQAPQQKTVDGFELHFGTNHLGHFALTGLLIEMIIETINSRIITMSSWGHKFGEIHFDDLDLDKNYSKGKAYAQSKLANLLFAYELQRKLEFKRRIVLSNASHPGWTRTKLSKSIIIRIFNPFMGMKPEKGALSMIYAATASEAEGGAYYGPNGRLGIKGYPIKVKSSEKSHNLELAKRLWEVSEDLTGIKFPI
ncbi:MAG: SDR family NAD(P)-dependent oxidoreductase [Candidatus Lokiarchaeota archaeon]|nr:SDR family NAD(P)-dependent oxidoreductase [Candidatus Lokiarchaeota archaeon]